MSQMGPPFVNSVTLFTDGSFLFFYCFSHGRKGQNDDSASFLSLSLSRFVRLSGLSLVISLLCFELGIVVFGCGRFDDERLADKNKGFKIFFLLSSRSPHPIGSNLFGVFLLQDQKVVYH
jgi:hypothetical protein